MTTYSKETALYDTGAIKSGIDDAANNAKGYMTDVTDNGVFVHEYDTSEPEPDDTGSNGVHISDKVDIIRNGNSVAEFGTNARVGSNSGTSSNVTVSNSAISFNEGNNERAQFAYESYSTTSQPYTRNVLKFIVPHQLHVASNYTLLTGIDFDAVDREFNMTFRERSGINYQAKCAFSSAGGFCLDADGYADNQAFYRVNVENIDWVRMGVGVGGDAHGLYSDKLETWLIHGKNSAKSRIHLGSTTNEHRVCPAKTSTSSSTGLYLGDSSYRWLRFYGSVADNISSDRKLKENIRDIDYAEELIMGLKPKEYQLKDSGHERTHMGFIAQDVAEVGNGLGKNLSLYEANYIDESKGKYHGEKVDDEELSWGLMYTELLAPMVSVIQKQHDEIESLKAEIAEIKEMLK